MYRTFMFNYYCYFIERQKKALKVFFSYDLVHEEPFGYRNCPGTYYVESFFSLSYYDAFILYNLEKSLSISFALT